MSTPTSRSAAGRSLRRRARNRIFASHIKPGEPMKFSQCIVAVVLAAAAGFAFAQSKEIRIAHVYDKTGPLEAYAKQTQAGVEEGPGLAGGGKKESPGPKNGGNGKGNQ